MRQHHKDSHEYKPPIKCPKCEKSFFGTVPLERHLAEEHGLNGIPYLIKSRSFSMNKDLFLLVSLLLTYFVIVYMTYSSYKNDQTNDGAAFLLFFLIVIPLLLIIVILTTFFSTPQAPNDKPSNYTPIQHTPTQQVPVQNQGSPTLSDLHHYKLTGSMPSGNMGADTQAAMNAYREQGKFDSTTKRN